MHIHSIFTFPFLFFNVMYPADVNISTLTTIAPRFLINVKSARTARALTVRGCAIAVIPGRVTLRASNYRLEWAVAVAVAGLTRVAIQQQLYLYMQY